MKSVRKTNLLQLAGIITVVLSIGFAFVAALAGESRLLRWIPILVVLASLALLAPILHGKDDDTDMPG